jgi:hypothetical protein
MGCGQRTMSPWIYCGIPTTNRGRTYLCPACEPVYCQCPMSDYDAIDQCRRCGRADLRAARVAAIAATVGLSSPSGGSERPCTSPRATDREPGRAPTTGIFPT